MSLTPLYIACITQMVSLENMIRLGICKIHEGKWLDDELPYHVVHRIASYPDVHGIFSDIMDYCFSHDLNIRIDTHRDNRIMQHNILKHGFSYCGIIYLASGDERLVYQKTMVSTNRLMVSTNRLMVSTNRLMVSTNHLLNRSC